MVGYGVSSVAPSASITGHLISSTEYRTSCSVAVFVTWWELTQSASVRYCYFVSALCCQVSLSRRVVLDLRQWEVLLAKGTQLREIHGH